MAVATSDSMEVTTNRDVTNEQLATELALSDAPAAEPEPAKTDPPKDTAQPKEPPAEAPAATDDDDENVDPASDAGKKLAARKRTLKDQLDKATWRFREEERKREALEKRLAEIEAPKAPAAQSKADSSEPDIQSYIDRIGTDFDTYEKALQAHSRDTINYHLAARDQASNAERQTHARQQTLHHIHTQGTAAHADFDAVLGQLVQNGGTLAPRNPTEAQGPLGDLEQVIFQHPLGHTIAYEVAKDAELYQRLMTAPSRVMFMAEMGKLITRLDGAPSGSPPKPATVSKAKAPIQPLGSSPVAADPDPDEIPFGPNYVKTMNRRFGK